MNMDTGPFGTFGLMIALWIGEILGVAVAPSDGGIHGYLVASGAIFSLSIFITRLFDIRGMRANGRRWIGAQAILPQWRAWQNRRAARAEARAAFGGASLAPSATQIEASLLRASLGYGPSEAEERIWMLEQSEIDETRASLERARDPSANLADLEALDMMGATSIPAPSSSGPHRTRL